MGGTGMGGLFPIVVDGGGEANEGDISSPGTQSGDAGFEAGHCL